jgi:uncharacterized protein YdhG (YjbR/CyaY superfamily)
MVQSKAATVAQYLKELPADRRKTIAAVRDVIRRRLPAGYEETMNWGMISYEVPLSVCPKTYNGQPLMYVALASQKNYCALYLMGVYGDAKLREELHRAFEAAGKKLDMGKSCVRFKSADDLPLEAIGKLIARVPIKTYVKRYQELKGK